MKSSDIKLKFAKYVSLNIIGMLGLSCYILADTFFVSLGIGANGLAALNLAIPVYSFINGTGLMIGMGGATRYAICKSDKIFTSSVCFGGISAFVFVLLGVFCSDKLALLLGADFETLSHTSVYLRTILCFSPLFLLNNIMICFVRNDKNPKLSMAAMLIGSLSNIILDYVFIFLCQMGMFGAAFATGIAPAVSLAVLSAHFIKKKNGFKLQRLCFKVKPFFDISALGVSALITELSSGVVMIVFNTLILRLEGNTGVAAYGIIANIALVVTAVFTGISQGIQPLISRSFSENNFADMKKILTYAYITAIAAAAAVYAASFIFAAPIVAAFNSGDDQGLAAIAVNGLRIYFTSFVFTGINIMTAAYCSAFGNFKTAFTISFLRGFALIIPLAVILSLIFKINGVWAAMTVAELLVLPVSLLSLRRRA